MSAFTISAICIEQLLCVYYPMKVRAWNMKAINKKLLLCTFVFLVAANWVCFGSLKAVHPVEGDFGPPTLGPLRMCEGRYDFAHVYMT